MATVEHVPRTFVSPLPRPAPRPRVVPIRPRLAVAEPLPPPLGSEATIDLQAPIDGLRLLRGDLEAYYWALPAEEDAGGRRYQVGLWMREVGGRTATLEAIVMHHASARLRVGGVSAEEAAALWHASRVLESSIGDEEPFARVLERVAAVLAAADRLALRAAGGVPA